MVNYTPDLSKAKEKLIRDISVDEIMYRAFPTVGEEMNVREAVDILVKKNLSGLPVVNEKKEVIGFLSEKDCLRIAHDLQYHNSPPGEVREYMTTHVSTISANASLFNAIRMFTHYNFHIIPVVEEGEVVGVLDRHTTLVHVQKMVQTTWQSTL